MKESDDSVKRLADSQISMKTDFQEVSGKLFLQRQDLDRRKIEITQERDCLVEEKKKLLRRLEEINTKVNEFDRQLNEMTDTERKLDTNAATVTQGSQLSSRRQPRSCGQLNP